MAINVKRVVLGKTARASSSRRGAYFRILDTDTGRRSYVKASGATRTKDAARARFSVAEQARIKKAQETPKRQRTEYEAAIAQDLEEATLHFRLDYTSEARSIHHQFQIRDSHITARVPKSWDDSQVHDYLFDLFKEAFSDQFGSELAQMLDATDLIRGLERGSGNAEGITIRYNHGGKAWRQATAPLGTVRDLITDKDSFFYGTLKRTRK